MKIILTETDETGLECKDTIIEWPMESSWYKSSEKPLPKGHFFWFWDGWEEHEPMLGYKLAIMEDSFTFVSMWEAAIVPDIAAEYWKLILRPSVPEKESK